MTEAEDSLLHFSTAHALGLLLISKGYGSDLSRTALPFAPPSMASGGGGGVGVAATGSGGWAAEDWRCHSRGLALGAPCSILTDIISESRALLPV